MIRSASCSYPRSRARAPLTSASWSRFPSRPGFGRCTVGGACRARPAWPPCPSRPDPASASARPRRPAFCTIRSAGRSPLALATASFAADRTVRASSRPRAHGHPCSARPSRRRSGPTAGRCSGTARTRAPPGALPLLAVRRPRRHRLLPGTVRPPRCAPERPDRPSARATRWRARRRTRTGGPLARVGRPLGFRTGTSVPEPAVADSGRDRCCPEAVDRRTPGGARPSPRAGGVAAPGARLRCGDAGSKKPSRAEAARRRRARVASLAFRVPTDRPSQVPSWQWARVRRNGICAERSPDTRKSPAEAGLLQVNPGGDLLSQGAPPQVPSAQAGLTAVFDMGTGVSPPPWPPEIYEERTSAP